MKVEGFEIPQQTLDAAAVWACTTLHFNYGELQRQLIRLKVPFDPSYRATDRLLQKWKKEGKILFRKSQWHWQGGQQ